MTAESLSAALDRVGVHGTVEARDRLAVLRVRPDVVAALTDGDVRRDVLRTAAEHGFTHVAIEVVVAEVDDALSHEPRAAVLRD